MANATIFARLKEDHDNHRALLARLSEGSGDRGELFETFRIEVTAHAAAEEETLYATMLANPDLRHDAQHSVAEHKEIDDLMEEVAAADPKSDAWTTAFDAMKHRYIHHIDEEEEEMFPAAAEGLDDDMVARLAERFTRRKPAEVARAEAGVDEGDDRD